MPIKVKQNLPAQHILEQGEYFCNDRAESYDSGYTTIKCFSIEFNAKLKL